MASGPQVPMSRLTEVQTETKVAIEFDSGRDGAARLQRPIRRQRFLLGCAALLAAVATMTGVLFNDVTAGTSRSRMPREGPDGRLKWLAFYGQSADENVLSGYGLVVLDPMFQGDLAQIDAGRSVLCAYLSLGEVRRTDEIFQRLDPACLLEENPAWPGIWRIDVRHKSWKDFVLQESLPAIRARGFKGLMIDTLDTPPWLEQSDPVANRGMGQASVELVRAIREACPDILMIVNRGYAILPHLCPIIDAVLAESLLTSPNPGGGYRYNSPGDVEIQLALLAPAKNAKPSLPILSLDYWDPADAAGVMEIYRRQRALDHQPYVATPLLGEIVPEPLDYSGSNRQLRDR